MTRALVAEFSDESIFLAAISRALADGRIVLEANAPFLPAAAQRPHDKGARRVTAVLAIGGLGMAVLFYGLEWVSATHAFPFNSGGRPFDSWPTFMLAPFEFGVFSAGFAGFIALLIIAGLPRLNHPLFEVRGFERASQDRFFLAVEADGGAHALLHEAGALSVQEVEL